MRIRSHLAGLAIAALLAPGASAQERMADGAKAHDLRLLLAVNDQAPGPDQANAQGMSDRLTRYINTAITPTASRPQQQGARSVAVVRPPDTSAPIESDADLDKLKTVMASAKAQAALVANVSADGDGVSTRATLLVPPETASADPWKVTYGDHALVLPLGSGIYIFKRVSVRPDHVVPDKATLAGATLGLVTQTLSWVPGLKGFYAANATSTEVDVSSFTAGVMAYHAGDFERAESLFARTLDYEPPGSNTRADAAVLRLASAARAAPARSRAQGHDAITFLSGELHRIDKLGDDVVKEFPYSVDARKVLVTFHLAVASQAPDSFFKGSSTRPYERHAAKQQLKALDILLDGQDAWSKRAHQILDALDD